MILRLSRESQDDKVPSAGLLRKLRTAWYKRGIIRPILPCVYFISDKWFAVQPETPSVGDIDELEKLHRRKRAMPLPRKFEEAIGNGQTIKTRRLLLALQMAIVWQNYNALIIHTNATVARAKIGCKVRPLRVALAWLSK